MTPVNHVAVVNRSGLGAVELALIVEAYFAELPAFCASWSLPAPGLAVYTPGHQQDTALEAALVVVDSANDPEAFGAHTALGAAIWGYVDLGLCVAYGEPISRVFGHELFEMVADPQLDRWTTAQRDGGRWAIEVCDPVQRISSEVQAECLGSKGAVEIADYCLPAFYDETSKGPWDALGRLRAPLTDATGGYHLVEKNGRIIATGAIERIASGSRTARRLAAKR